MHVTTLPNGLTLAVERAPGARPTGVSLRLLGGTRGDEIPGIALLAARALPAFRFGNDERPLSRRCAELGAEMSARVAMESFEIRFRVAPERLPELLRLVAGLFEPPSGREVAVEDYLPHLLGALPHRRNPVLYRAIRAGLRGLFGACPEFQALYGDDETTNSALDRLTVTTLEAWLSRRLQPANVALGSAGAHDPEELLQLCRASLGGLTPGSRLAIEWRDPDDFQPGKIGIPDEHTALAVLSFPFPGLASADFPKLELLHHLLFRHQPELLLELVDPGGRQGLGLEYRWNDGLLSAGSDRMVLHVLLTAPQGREPHGAALLRAIESRVSAELAAYDVAAAAESYRLLRRLDLEETYRCASWLSLAALSGNPMLLRLPDVAAAISRDQLAAVARRFLSSERCFLTTVRLRARPETPPAASAGTELLELPNGCRLLLHPVPGARLATVHLALTGNLDRDPPDGPGLHALAVSALLAPERRHGAGPALRTLLHARPPVTWTIDPDLVSWQTRCLPERAADLTTALGDWLLEPRITPVTLRAARTSLGRLLEHRWRRPFDRLSLHLTKLLFRGHPYRHPPEGVPEVHEAARPDELLELLEPPLDAGRMILVVAGAFDPAAVRNAVEQSFGLLPGDVEPLPATIPNEPAHAEPIIGDHPFGMAIVGRIAPRITEDNLPLYFVASHLLDSILVRDPLYRRVRARSGSYIQPLREGTVVYAWFMGEPALAELFPVVMEERLAAVREIELTPAQLEQLGAASEQLFLSRGDPVTAASLARWAACGLPAERLLQDLPRRIRQADPAEIQRFAAAIYDAPDYSTLVIQPPRGPAP
jgi:predicted Zn-dependent peptidase